jgi:hypothetical protein
MKAMRKSLLFSGLTALALPLFTIQANAAAHDLLLDTPETVNGVAVACTGVGSDAREDPRWNDYSLKLVLAGKQGQYLGAAEVTVEGNGVSFTVRCGGPWLLFDLAPGRYTITGRTDGQSESLTANAPETGQGRAIMRFPDLGGEVSAEHEPAQD